MALSCEYLFSPEIQDRVEIEQPLEVYPYVSTPPSGGAGVKSVRC
ncbi:hypothetical protein [Caudoviricetes sp.]|nr:hypothetical protein [Caudoviricetes sp.]